MLKQLFWRGNVQHLTESNTFEAPATKKISLKKSKNVTNKAQNPRWGRVGVTNNNYSTKNDDTQIDNIVSEIRSDLRLDVSYKTKLSGLSGKPRRSRNHWRLRTKNNCHESKHINVREKLYKLGLEFQPEDLGITEQQFAYDTGDDYTEAVIKPLNAHLRSYLYEYHSVKKHVSAITGAFKRNGRVSVWMDIWCPITAKEIYHHLVRFRTSLMSVKPDVSISVLDKIIEKPTFDVTKIYDDYSVQAKLFEDLNEELYEALGIDPVKWKNQELLCKLIGMRFNDLEIEHSPTWLGQQRFDMYIPSKKTAIEYQGIQHYQPVSIFGGEEGYKKTVARDRKKIDLASQNGVRVLHWHYTVEVNDRNVSKFIKDHLSF